jgi:lon-related putative ATP-dependent protease
MTVKSTELASSPRRLDPAMLRRTCSSEKLGFATTDELPAFEGLVGQSRALEALDLGARIDKPGFNMFILGERGTARHGIVRTLVEKHASRLPSPQDWIYVANWEQPDRPRAIPLPAGRGQRFKSALDAALEELISLVPAIFESPDYKAKRRSALDTINTEQEHAFEALSTKARAEGIALLRTQSGFSFAPIADKAVMPPETFNALPEDQRKTILDKIEALQSELAVIIEKLPVWERERRQKQSALDHEHARLVVTDVMKDVEHTVSDLPALVEHIRALNEELVRYFGVFRFLSIARQDEEGEPQETLEQDDPKLKRFRVNLLVGDGAKPSAPVVTEDNPSIGNLIGRIEQQAHMGALFTDFSLIRPGSLHLANGGYLLIDARRLLLEPYAWEMLKRALRARSISIESPTDRMSIMATLTLKPDPIPLNVKVVLFGDRALYYALFAGDPDFSELFKIAVEFEDTVEWNDATTRDYAHLIASIARREGLKPLSAAAVSLVMEESSREAEDSRKLSLRVGSLADHLREADFWATEAGHDVIDAVDIERATLAWKQRHERIRVQGQEMIERNIMLVDTAGAKIGQINGLSVTSYGGYAFGRPVRITASVRVGTGEVMDVEREVELGGPLHSKGVLIISSYLSSTYASQVPHSLHASIVFEQSYGGIDGDSASSTELYAILSALSGIPIRQGLAVTGSVNQRGEVQAIGGVNEKIEGFFALCKFRGLDGTQGVLIPKANEQHLMLDKEIVDACRKGLFHVFSVSTIDEGMEILSGLPSGTRAAGGQYPSGSINHGVEEKLLAFAETRRAFLQPVIRG